MSQQPQPSRSEEVAPQRQLIDLKRRSKELDAREESLVERERFLEAGPLSIEVLEETIRVKRKQLASLEDELETARKRTEDDEQLAAKRLKALEKAVEDYRKESDAARFQASQQTEELEKVKAEKGLVHVELAERKQYLVEQEQLIANTIEDGNMQLKSIQYQIAPLEEVKLSLESEISVLDSQKSDLILEADRLRQENAQLDSQGVEAQEAVEKSIKAAESSLKDVTDRSKKVATETETKLQRLKAEEEKIIVERKSIAKERADIQTERRRWESTKSLYGI